MDDRATRVEAIADEARRLEEDATHSSQSQFEAAREWNGWNLGIGIPATASAAAATAAIVGEHPLAAGLLALIAAILSGLATFLKPSERAASCLNAGNAYNTLRNDARIFRTIQCVSLASVEELEEALLALNDRRNALNSEAPNPPRRAYTRGRARIEEGETTHLVDKQG